MFTTGIAIGILAYVYSNILTDDGMILEKFYDYSLGLPEDIHKPLITCAYCVSGQMALWSYFFLFPYYGFSFAHLITHFIFIGLAIFTVDTILTLKNRWK